MRALGTNRNEGVGRGWKGAVSAGRCFESSQGKKQWKGMLAGAVLKQRRGVTCTIMQRVDVG